MHTGGVRLTTRFFNYSISKGVNRNKLRETAIQYFLKNSSFKILTNSSISCITLKATLNNNIETPFKSMRSNNIDLEINSMLLKIFITNPTQSGFIPIPGRGNYNGIELTSISTFEKEIQLQQDIYKKSFCSTASIFDGICPAIIYYNKAVNATYITALQNLTSFGMSQLEQDKLNEILNVLNNPNIPMNISIIYMEMMENYDIATNVFNFVNNQLIPRDNQELYLLYSIQYEFKRLHSFGYLHGDAHFGNIMVNKNYQYFKDFVGRVIIIDFGRTTKLTQSQIQNPQTIPTETYSNYIPRNYILNNGNYDILRNSRLKYINSALIPKIQNIFNFTGSLIDLITNIMNEQDRYIYGGKAKIQSNKKIEIHTKPNIYITKNMKPKDFFSKKISNNTSEEMDANANELFEYIRLESEKMNPSDLFAVQPISKQIKNMKLDEFTDIIRNQMLFNDNKPKSKSNKSNKKTNNKTNNKTNKKTKSNKKTNNKTRSNK